MGQYRTLIILAVCTAVSPIGLLIPAPALPAIRDAFSASLSETQTVLAAYSVALAIGMLLCGPLADRFEKKWVLLSGMGLFSAGALIAYAAPTIEVLVFARIVQGAGAAAASIIPRAMLAEIYKGDELNRAMSILIMFIVIGPMIAPIAGGYIVDAASWREIMLLLLFFGMLSAFTAAFFLKTSEDTTARTATMLDTVREQAALFRNVIFLANVTALAAIQIGVYIFLAISPYLVIDVLGYSAAEFGYVFVYLTLGYLAGNFTTSVFVKRLGGVPMVFGAAIIFLIGVGVLALLSGWSSRSVVTIIGPAFLLTFANGVTQPNTTAGALSVAEERKGAAASLSGFVQIMAAAVGVQVSGILGAASIGPSLLALFICGGAALAATVVLMMKRQKAPPEAPTVQAKS